MKKIFNEDKYVLMTPNDLVDYAKKNPNDGKAIARIINQTHTQDYIYATLEIAAIHGLSQEPIFKHLAHTNI